jgi:hypothetical protein
MNGLDVISTQVTMSSLELVEFIKAHEDRDDLTHANFMAKVPKVLGEGGLIQFKDTYIHPQNGQPYPMYRFPKREACLMAMSYSYELQAKVYDHMMALEAKLKAQTLDGKDSASTAVKLIIETLHLEGSAKLAVVTAYTKHHAPELLPALPVYAIDAPMVNGLPAVSSLPTLPATVLLQKFGVTLSAQKFNTLLEAEGYMETLSRKSSKGGADKVFKNITEKGLPYGKNVTSPQNPRETQPHWYTDKFGVLLQALGVSI